MTSSASAAPPTVDRRLLAGFALAAALASVYLMRGADADLWGHLRYGRLFVEERGLPAADPFAWTSAGRQWSSHEYLSQVLLWLAYAAGGSAGLVVLKCLVGGAALFFLYAAIRLGSADARVWAPVLLVTSHVLGRWFLFRPQLFTFAFFAFFVWVLFRHLLGRRARLWLLPAATTVWANLHGGFLAGLGAVGLALLLRGVQKYNAASKGRQAPVGQEQEARAPCSPALWPLGLTLAACGAASLLNPLGWRLWPYLAAELSCDVNRRFIEEWQPLSAAHGWTAVTFLALLGLLLAAGLLAGNRPLAGLRPWQWLLSCLPLAVMACRSVRHVPICTLWVAPVLALLAQAAHEARAGRRWWQWAGTTVMALAAVPALLTFRFIAADPAPAVSTAGPVLGAHAPYGAAEFLRQHGPAGRVYNPLWWGSYLTWELYPDVLVSADGRNVTLFSSDQVAENLNFYLSEDADAGAPLRGRPDFLLVPADAPVLPRLRGDARWVLVFDDGDAAVFVPARGAVPAPSARILRKLRQNRPDRLTEAPERSTFLSQAVRMPAVKEQAGPPRRNGQQQRLFLLGTGQPARQRGLEAGGPTRAAGQPKGRENSHTFTVVEPVPVAPRV